MTLTAEPPLAADPPGESGPTQSSSETKRSRRRWWWALLLLPVIALVGWWAAGQSALGGVRVQFDAQPVVCEGGAVSTTASLDSEEYVTPMVSLHSGMSCRIRAQVVNDGWTDASIDAVRMPMFGPENAWGVYARFANPNAPRAVPSEDGLDVTFPLDRGFPVLAGTTQLIEIAVDYNDLPSMAPCTSIWINVPLIDVSAFDQGRTIEPDARNAIGWQKGSDAECN